MTWLCASWWQLPCHAWKVFLWYFVRDSLKITVAIYLLCWSSLNMDYYKHVVCYLLMFRAPPLLIHVDIHVKSLHHRWKKASPGSFWIFMLEFCPAASVVEAWRTSYLCWPSGSSFRQVGSVFPGSRRCACNHGRVQPFHVDAWYHLTRIRS